MENHLSDVDTCEAEASELAEVSVPYDFNDERVRKSIFVFILFFLISE